MTAKEYEQRKIELLAYQDTLRKLNRRISEAAAWHDRATRSSEGVAKLVRSSRSGRPAHDPAYAKTIAMSIDDECEQLTAQAWAMREQLCACIALVDRSELREILEACYINGQTLAQLAEPEQLNRAEKTLAARLRRAVIRLAECSDFFLSGTK